MERDLRLTIELVPKTCWYSNLAGQLPKHDWDKIRKLVYYHSEYRCEICGGVGDKWPVECHELWDYDDQSHVQTLKGFLCLCPACHEVKHYGRAYYQGNKDRVFDHFRTVNLISKEHANIIIRNAFEDWQERSAYEWDLDIEIIKGMDVDISKLVLIRS